MSTENGNSYFSDVHIWSKRIIAGLTIFVWNTDQHNSPNNKIFADFLVVVVCVCIQKSHLSFFNYKIHGIQYHINMTKDSDGIAFTLTPGLRAGRVNLKMLKEHNRLEYTRFSFKSLFQGFSWLKGWSITMNFSPRIWNF